MIYNVYFRWPDGDRDSFQCSSRKELVRDVKALAEHRQILEDVLDGQYESFSRAFYDKLERDTGARIEEYGRFIDLCDLMCG